MKLNPNESALIVSNNGSIECIYPKKAVESEENITFGMSIIFILSTLLTVDEKDSVECKKIKNKFWKVFSEQQAFIMKEYMSEEKESNTQRVKKSSVKRNSTKKLQKSL